MTRRSADRIRSTADERQWQAVLARDSRLDGAVFFGVRTTGIYCRPSCPARRPRREHVVFFGRPEAAEGAGFRACRRCRPRDAAPSQVQTAWLRRLCRRLEQSTPPRLADLGAEFGLSPHHLQRTFKRLVGLSPRQYAEAARQGVFRAQLRKGEPVTQALYEAGFGSTSRVYEKSANRLGMTPGAYRKGGRGMRIRYTIVDSRQGRLLVAATERGIAAVSLGASDAALETALRQEYRSAHLERDDAGLARRVATILAGLRRGSWPLDLPLDIQATAFQWRVWQALRAIPPGQTRSYGEVARALGQPRAARAVARACATNPVALVIPCHRVVAAGGGLGGYRWGVQRKRALLEGERAAQGRRAPAGTRQSNRIGLP